MHKLEGYKCFFSMRSKEKKEKKGKSDNLFQFEKKLKFRPLFSSKAIISSFLVWFE
jgi:hypothetical protein